MSTATEKQAFDPRSHLSRLQGKEYLEVKWRLVWFRSEHPEGTIETQVIALTDQWAVFQATVSCERGRAMATGSETPKDFRDYIEKAETKAIGRALAHLGYGTQFAPDIEMLNEDGTPHVVDTPVKRRSGYPDTGHDMPPRRGSSYGKHPYRPAATDEATGTN